MIICRYACMVTVKSMTVTRAESSGVKCGFGMRDVMKSWNVSGSTSTCVWALQFRVQLHYRHHACTPQPPVSAPKLTDLYRKPGLST